MQDIASSIRVKVTNQSQYVIHVKAIDHIVLSRSRLLILLFDEGQGPNEIDYIV